MTPRLTVLALGLACGIAFAQDEAGNAQPLRLAPSEHMQAGEAPAPDDETPEPPESLNPPRLKMDSEFSTFQAVTPPPPMDQSPAPEAVQPPPPR